MGRLLPIGLTILSIRRLPTIRLGSGNLVRLRGVRLLRMNWLRIDRLGTVRRMLSRGSLAPRKSRWDLSLRVLILSGHSAAPTLAPLLTAAPLLP